MRIGYRNLAFAGLWDKYNYFHFKMGEFTKLSVLFAKFLGGI